MPMDNSQSEHTKTLDGLAEIFELTDQQIQETRFYQAICDGNIDLVKHMISNSKMINPDRVLTWHSVFILDDTPGVIEDLPITHRFIYADPNKFKDLQPYAEPFLPLTLAVTKNKRDIVDFLVEECKVNINACFKGISHPLFAAVDSYNIELVQYLVDHGANPLYKETISIHNNTVLGSIDRGLSMPEELGDDRIEKLQEIKAIIEKKLKETDYSDPYAGAENSSSSDEGSGTEDNDDDDTGSTINSNDQNNSQHSHSILQNSDPCAGAKNSSSSDDTTSSDSDEDNDDDATSSTDDSDGNTTDSDGDEGNDDDDTGSTINSNDQNNSQHSHSTLQIKHSWKIITFSIIGIVCSAVCIKKIYNWYIKACETDDKEIEQNDQNNLVDEKLHETL
jgi:hypothetical protein